MSFDVTRREALGLLGAAAGTLLMGPVPALADDDKDSESAADSGKGEGGGDSDSSTPLYAAKTDANSNWGFVDVNGSWVIKPAFGNLAGTPGNANHAVPNASGQSVLRDNQINDNLGWRGGVFDGDLFPAAKPKDNPNDSDTWGYIDREGNWAIEPQYLYATCFINGYAIVQDKSKDYHFITPKGKDAFGKLDCKTATPFFEGYASLYSGDAWGIIDTKGAWALNSAKDTTAPYQYKAPLVFNEGKCFDDFKYIDTKGNTIFEFSEQAQKDCKRLYDDYKDTEAPIFKSFHQDRLFYGHRLYDAQGNALTELSFDAQNVEIGTYQDELIFNEDLCAAKDPVTHTWGYIDNTGAWAIKPQFSEAYSFGQGLAMACDPASDCYGFIDKSGDWKIAPRFRQPDAIAGALSSTFDANGRVFVWADLPADGNRNKMRMGWIDTDGNWVFSWER